MQVTHVTVTALPGRQTPVNSRDGVEPGGGPLFVTDAVVCRVAYTHTTIRSLNRRDLILCNMDGKHVQSAELAAAPDDLPGGKITLPRKAKAGAP